MNKRLDVITIGRSSVDLYGGQVGGRLEDMASFSKYIGGSPTNIAAGAARLGLRSALITRVGDEHLGRFIREELQREGVDTRSVRTDPQRLTALAILGIRNDEEFPLIFYRENCADMALSTEDIDPEFILESRCVCATGTHLSHPATRQAVLKALEIARDAEIRTALDIDFRPNLWGLAGHGEGSSRFIASRRVTGTLQEVLGMFDLIVGTEEEFHIAGGSTDTVQALRSVRQLTPATLVCKRGPMGATAFDDVIPDNLDEGVAGRGFEVEVFNVLGAGDGFMAGLLKGWLTNEDWSRSLEFANACGAFAVSRHGCAPSYPSWEELGHFLERGIRTPALRKDRDLEQIHWSTNRNRDWHALCILDFDDRQLDLSVDEKGPITEFKRLCLEAVRGVAQGRCDCGVICDGGTGRSTLMDATGTGLWIGRPADLAGSTGDSGTGLPGHDFGEFAEWPIESVVIARCPIDAGADVGSGMTLGDTLPRLFSSARRNRLELLVELPEAGGQEDRLDHTVKLIRYVYGLGVYPDWWMLRPEESGTGWKAICSEIEDNDRYSRGIILNCLDAQPETLPGIVDLAIRHDLVRGISAGRQICRELARHWLDGTIDADNAIRRISSEFKHVCEVFDRGRVRK